MLTVVDTPKLQLMKSTSETTLGYVIAYVAPGAVSLWGSEKVLGGDPHVVRHCTRG
jgi:hypothetical protein